MFLLMQVDNINSPSRHYGHFSIPSKMVDRVDTWSIVEQFLVKLWVLLLFAEEIVAIVLVVQVKALML